MPELPAESNRYYAEHVDMMRSSFRHLLGREWIEGLGGETSAIAKHIFEAKFAVLSHDTQKDPLFNYANRAAMELFEMDWSQLVRTPSRMSAEPVNRAERERLLQAVSTRNYIDDYSGVRISASGTRFHIPEAIVWNLVDSEGVYRGQAATFSEWEFLP